MGKAKARHIRTSKKGKTFLAGKGAKKIPVKKLPLKELLDERADELVLEARKELEVYEKTGTYRSFVQANEKGWFAFKQKLSSIAGRRLTKAGQIKAFIKKNPKYYKTFQSALAMHNQSFAGDWLPDATAIKSRLKDVERFIK